MLPIANIQGFLKKCITFSWVDWLRNGESLRNGPIYMEDPVVCITKKTFLLGPKNIIALHFFKKVREQRRAGFRILSSNFTKRL